MLPNRLMLTIKSRNKFQNKLRKSLKKLFYSRLLPQNKKMLLIKTNLFKFLHNLFNLNNNLWFLEGIIPRLLLEETINFWEVKTRFKEVHLLRLHLSTPTPWVLQEEAGKPEPLETLVNNRIIHFPLKALQILYLVKQLRILLENKRVTMEMEGWATHSQLQIVIQGPVLHGWKVWQDKHNLHGFKATTMLQEDPYSVHSQTNSRTQCLDLQVCQEEISCPTRIPSQPLPLHQWTQVWCRHVNDDNT